MAANAFAFLEQADGTWLAGEAQVPGAGPRPLLADLPPAGTLPVALVSWSLDVVQTLNIGSQSTGAGAGKITFDPVSLTKPVDRTSPVLFQMEAEGATLKQLALLVERTGATGATGDKVYLEYLFEDVAVKSTSWSPGTTDTTEVVTFEYGTLIVGYAEQLPDGQYATPVHLGWDRVRNIAADGTLLPSDGGGGGGTPPPVVREAPMTVALPVAAGAAAVATLAWQRRSHARTAADGGSFDGTVDSESPAGPAGPQPPG